MKKRLLRLTLVFALLILLITSAFYLQKRKAEPPDQNAMQIVNLNEIAILLEKGEINEARSKIERMQNDLAAENLEQENHDAWPFLIALVGIIFLLSVFSYVYFSILRPFEKMEAYASKIAAGNLDLPLDYERSNYFGKFTWAFDSMRREIVRARNAEKEAIENNKTMIASLSHDIKTPIASIRAYSEALQAGLDKNIEKRERYISVILAKCDEVSALSEDLFIHSLADLAKLQMQYEKSDIFSLAREFLEQLSRAGQAEIIIEDQCQSEGISLIDTRRFTQILENLIANARKYAKTPVKVKFACDEKYNIISVRDYGPGIADADLPFIKQKFYRGENAAGQEGAGLGLYIVNHLVEQMQGEFELINHQAEKDAEGDEKGGVEIILKFLRTS